MGRTKTKQKKENHPIKGVGVRRGRGVGGRLSWDPLRTVQSRHRAAEGARREAGHCGDALGRKLFKEIVAQKQNSYLKKRLHEKNPLDSVIAIPQSRQPSVHKAVPISSRPFETY